MKNNEFSASFSTGTLRQARVKFTHQDEPKAPDNGCMIYVVEDETAVDRSSDSFVNAVNTVIQVN
jgi:hypothetical protein